MKRGQPDLSDRAFAEMLNSDSMFDRRAILIGVGLSVLMVTIATLWTVAYHDRSQKAAKLKDFEFAPRPPDVEKFELKEPQRELMREMIQDRPDFQEKESTPNIQMTTELKDVEPREEVVKVRNLEMKSEIDVRSAKLDIQENMEKVDEMADQRVDALTPIAVLSTSPGDIYKYTDPKPRASPRAQLVSTSPRPGMQLKVAPRQFGDQDAVTAGELGPVDINLLGNGDYLAGMGRAGMETRTAVDSALHWLALHQEPEGWWSPKRWDLDDSSMTKPAGGEISKEHSKEHVHGVSALAILALMGGGNTLRKGEHRLTVLRAVQWLVDQQNPKTGFISTNMYEHALGTIALCEAFGRSPDEKIGMAARKAVDACVAAIGKDGGWRYTPNADESDVSVSSWFLQALKTAKLANIKFDHSVFSKGLTYIDQCTDRGGMANSSGGVGYQYKPDLAQGEGSPALTCAGMVIRQFNGMGVKHPLLNQAAELTKRRPPKWDGDKDFYYWYYATYAMHNMGGEARLWWNRRIRDTLLDHQSKRGHQNGSWSPEKARWEAGRVYCTALGALCLEVYYRYGEALQSFGTVPDLDELTFQ
jgi:hypothetical protein